MEGCFRSRGNRLGRQRPTRHSAGAWLPFVDQPEIHHRYNLNSVWWSMSASPDFPSRHDGKRHVTQYFSDATATTQLRQLSTATKVWGRRHAKSVDHQTNRSGSNDQESRISIGVKVGRWTNFISSGRLQKWVKRSTFPRLCNRWTIGYRVRHTARIGLLCGRAAQ